MIQKKDDYMDDEYYNDEEQKSNEENWNIISFRIEK
jgi:hypothetical protein